MNNDIFSGISQTDLAVLAFVAVLYAAIFGSLFLGWLVNYILRGVGIYKMSKNRGLSGGGLGFVPFVHRYQFGKLAGEIQIFNKKIKNTGLWLVFLPVISGIVLGGTYVASFIPMIISAIANPTAIDSNPLPFLHGIFGGLGIFVLLAVFAQIIINLIFGLSYHKLYSRYSGGQRPVAYLILTLFVPLAEGIIFFMHRDRQVIAEDSIE